MLKLSQYEAGRKFVRQESFPEQILKIATLRQRCSLSIEKLSGRDSGPGRKNPDLRRAVDWTTRGGC
jgi:hypothetical protein